MAVTQELDEFEDPTSVHPRRRLVIVQRPDGYYSLAQQYHYRSEFEAKIVAEGWHTLGLEGIFESLDLAKSEAQLTMDRLSQKS